MPDIRNSKVVDIVHALQVLGCALLLHDPVAHSALAMHEYGLSLHVLGGLDGADTMVLAVPHDIQINEGWSLPVRLLRQGGPPLLDVPARLERAAAPAGVDIWRM